MAENRKRKKVESTGSSTPTRPTKTLRAQRHMRYKDSETIWPKWQGIGGGDVAEAMGETKATWTAEKKNF